MNNKIDSITSLLNKKKPGVQEIIQGDVVQEINLSLIEFDSQQPRQEFLENEVDDIVRTLNITGGKINQPVTLWPKNTNGKYLIRFGEKRVRASIKAGKNTIPALIENVLKFDSDKDKHINFQEQYIENDSRSGLTPLDDCVALSKIYENLGSLKKVIEFKGKGSAGTISDKIKVSKLKTDPRFQYLYEYYQSKECKVKDLTTYKLLIDILDINPENFDLIIDKVKRAIKKGKFNRQFIKQLALEDFEKESETTPETEEIKEEIKEETFKVISYKKVRLSGVVNIKRKKHPCKVLLNRKDSENGFIWVVLDGEKDAIRVDLASFSLTGLNNAS